MTLPTGASPPNTPDQTFPFSRHYGTLKSKVSRRARRGGEHVPDKNVTRLVTSMFVHDRSQLRVIVGLRNAAGIGLPLIIGALTGEMSDAVIIAIGALIAGLAGLSGTLHQRMRLMWSTTLWMSAAIFAASFLGRFDWLAVLITAISGFWIGMMVAVSPGAAQVGTFAGLGLVIFIGMPGGLLFSARETVLALSGGILQIVLMGATERLSALDAETLSVAGMFNVMAVYTANPTDVNDFQISQALASAESNLIDSSLPLARRESLYALVLDAWQIRRALSTLTMRGGTKLRALPPSSQTLATRTPEERVSSILQHIGSAVLHGAGSGKTANGPAISELTQEIAAWSQESTGIDGRTHKILQRHFASILAVFSASPTQDRPKLPAAPAHNLRTMAATIRAHLNFHSSVFRFALRMGVILGVSVILYHYIPLPLGYWVPLTALLVLKPDFFTTLVRSLDRVLGTLGGVVLATLLMAIPHLHTQLAVGLVIVFAISMYAVLNYNFALFTLFITAEIVVLLSFFEHLAPMATIEARGFDTLIGTGLALSAHLLWPRWQRSTVPKALDNLVHSSLMYLDYLLSHTGPGMLTGANTAYYRLQLRIASANADSAVQHVLMRTDQRPVDATAAAGILTALSRLATDLQRLEGELVHLSLTQDGTQDALDRLRAQLDRRLRTVEAVLRNEPTASTLLTESLGEYSSAQEEQDPATASEPIRAIAQNLSAHVALILRMLPLTPRADPS